MAKITAPVEDFGGVVAGVQFVKGSAEVGDDSEYLRYFVEAGYTVEAEEAAPAFPDGDPSAQWKTNELKAYAAANGFDLAGATNKEAIVAAIAAAAAAAAQV